MAAKERLDKLLVLKGLCESRHRAQALIMAGVVLVDDVPVEKAGTQIRVDAELRLKRQPLPYVSRGGNKLQAALEAFDVAVQDAVAVDLGASTGGFTDCLLQHGCAEVVAIDVGYGQLHPKLRNDPRVHCMERTNARHLQRADLPLEAEADIDLICADLSFISIKLILPTIDAFLRPGGDLLLLLKPQFEAGREQVSKGGVVRDDAIRHQCADQIAQEAALFQLDELARIDCPVHGPKGNVEILMHLKKREDPEL